MYFIYTIIYTIVIISLLPFEYFKRPKDLRKRWLREKFGLLDSLLSSHHPPISPIGNRGCIWVHAVSVGEVMAASPLLIKIREHYPSKKIILSTITDTGQKVAGERAPEGTGIMYLPFDIFVILNAVVKRLKPEILIVIETELWPNLFRVFRENRIPVILLNGRISEKSFRGYRKISFFMRKVLSHVNFFGMQSEEYAGRIRSLGVGGTRVQNLGNFKFDTKPPSQISGWTAEIRGPVIIAGSTHEGEEEMITSVYIELRKVIPDLNLVIAPRHPERFKSVEEMLRSKKIAFAKRSEFGARNTKSEALIGTIVLLDTVGELSAMYGLSDIAIIGKSFRGFGGQNPLEPAYWGKPIICGPHMENFPVIKDFYDAGAAVMADEKELFSTLKELLLFPERAKEIGSKAREIYTENAGAVERALNVMAKYISE